MTNEYDSRLEVIANMLHPKSEVAEVDARALHRALGIQKDFSNWIKAQFNRGGFEDGVDYWEVQPPARTSGSGGRNRRDYLLTNSTAKHIAMMSSRSAIPKSQKTYFIFNPMTNMIKIGKSNDVERRMNTLSTQSGCELELLHVIDEDVELELHAKFKHIRHHGEWFYDDGQIREFICSEYQ